MRIRIAIVGLFLLFGTSAHAGIFGSKSKLPHAHSQILDNPRPSESHKAGRKSVHPRKLQDIMWGNQWKQVLYPDRNYQLPHYNRN
ncbi:MAG TPA: hypothetical protein VN083_05280 [Vicinamibacteria bacterium]|jgi:hypothetical protein|nr:hypothetical protein [Vicinamibacteria bacterium]